MVCANTLRHRAVAYVICASVLICIFNVILNERWPSERWFPLRWSSQPSDQDQRSGYEKHLPATPAPPGKGDPSPGGAQGRLSAVIAPRDEQGREGAAALGKEQGHSSPVAIAPPPVATASPKLKYILYWNEFYGSMVFGWGAGQKPFIENGCEVNTCFGTNNRSLMKMDEYDAILLHVQTVYLFGWPAVRAPHQRYVFVTLESAQYVTVPLSSDKYRSAFNLTMTYRRDSDFPFLYGMMEPVPSPPPVSTRNYAAGKTKLVAWFVSNCNSRSNRETYVRKLQKHIPVDIYGKCGPLKCPRSGDNKCHKTLLNKDYKFYLSFENSICNDYVTEKLFDTLKYDVVPVVLGGANYSSIAPPGSYIDALKYTPEELAKYLLKLDKDDAAYNAFFQWKGKYKSREKNTYAKSAFCDLCKYLHSNETKQYTNMHNWWIGGQCQKIPF